MNALLIFLKDLPAIWVFLKQVKAYIDAQEQAKNRAALLSKLGDGIEKAHKEGDTSDIENLFKPNIGTPAE